MTIPLENNWAALITSGRLWVTHFPRSLKPSLCENRPSCSNAGSSVVEENRHLLGPNWCNWCDPLFYWSLPTKIPCKNYFRNLSDIFQHQLRLFFLTPAPGPVDICSVPTSTPLSLPNSDRGVVGHEPVGSDPWAHGMVGTAGTTGKLRSWKMPLHTTCQPLTSY